MAKKFSIRLLSVLFSAGLVMTSTMTTTASTQNVATVEDTAKAYVAVEGNTVTKEGLLAAVKSIEPDAELSDSDFFIKHAVPGVKDNDETNPLNIPGSNGAVAAIFTVNGNKIGVTAPIAHEVETLVTNETVIVSKDNTDFTFNERGNVIGYSGTAEKIVIPSDTSIVITSQAKLDNVKVVIINNEVGQPAGDNEVGSKDASSFAGWQNLTAVQYNVAGPYWFSTNFHGPMFQDCINLKYIKCPDRVHNAVGTSDYIGVDTFNGCTNLENVILPNVNIPWGGPTSVAKNAFKGTAVRDFFLPGEQGAISVQNDIGSFSEPSFVGGTRNVITYNTDMTLVRAAALIEAKLSEIPSDSYILDSKKLNIAKGAVTGSHDAQAFIAALTLERNGSDKLSLKNQSGSIDVDFEWTVSDDIVSTVKNYIQKAGNNATQEDITELITLKDANATIDSFFIKHAVPGVKDNDQAYPLNIPGSDGATAVIFTVDGLKYTCSAAFSHDVEILETNETVVVTSDNTDFTFNEHGNVIGYSGTAEKIVIPANTSFVITSQAKLNNVKVVIINNQVDQPAGDNEVGVKDATSFAGWQNLKAVQYNVAGPYWFTTNFHSPVFQECHNLKYVKCPDRVHNAGGTSDYIGVDTFSGCTKLENIILPNIQKQWNSPTSVAKNAFSGTAVRDFFLPGEQGAISVQNDLGSFANPTFVGGTRNVITYDMNMTMTRAIALAAAKSNELKNRADLTDDEILAQIKSSITGSSDAETFFAGLTFEQNGSDKFNISNGTDTIAIDCVWISSLNGDANRDNVTDVKDIVRLKKYSASNNVAINVKAVDFNEDSILNALDMASLKQLVLSK